MKVEVMAVSPDEEEESQKVRMRTAWKCVAVLKGSGSRQRRRTGG